MREKMDERMCAGLLERHGIKPTANRIVVLKALAAADRPVSLSELEHRIITIDKSGIFRTLSIFREQHMVHVIEDGGDGVRYELCRSSDKDNDDDIHVHFYCERCNRTFCMSDIQIPPVTLPEGYRTVSVNYMVKGICPDCARKER